MQGQNRNQNGAFVPGTNGINEPKNGFNETGYTNANGSIQSQKSQSFSADDSYDYDDENDSNMHMENNEGGEMGNGSSEVRSTSNSDQITTQSDNISTIPLKSLTSMSTKSPSVLSSHQDNGSGVASTAETSIAPSIHTSTANYQALNPHSTQLLQQANYDRDSESIVTLASSSRRVRRRSLDTNSSTAGIPPASIMERLAIHPNAASIHNSNDRTSIYNATSQSSTTDLNDQASSVN